MNDHVPSDDTGDRARRSQAVQAPLVLEVASVFGLFGLLSLALTWPGVLTFSTHFLGDGGDGLQNVWNMWWLDKALFEERTNPYFTNFLHHPHGVTLLFQTFNPFNGLLSLPLQRFFGMMATYNTIVIFSFAASGTTMYLLAKHLTGSPGASFVAGMVFTFSSYHFAHGLGHLQLIAMEWLPLYVLFLWRCRTEPGFRNALLAGIALALNALCSWYYMLYCLFFTGLLLLAVLVQERGSLWRSGFIARVAVALTTFFLLLSPLLLAMIHARVTETFTGQHAPGVYSADLLSFVVPGGTSTWGRLWFEDIWSQWTGNRSENGNTLGFVVLACSIYGVWRVREARFWGAVGLGFAVLALGPELHVGGEVLSIRLPYYYLHKYVPLIDFTGVAGRCTVMAILGFSLTTAFALARWIPRRLPPPAQVWGFALVSALVALENLAIPFATAQPPVSEFYHRMARDPERYAVIDVAPRRRSRTLYYATIHGKPLIGGYVSRPTRASQRFLRETPVLASLFARAPHPGPEASRRLATEIFERYDIRYVISRHGQRRGYIEDVLGLPLVFEDEGLRAYEARPAR